LVSGRKGGKAERRDLILGPQKRGRKRVNLEKGSMGRKIGKKKKRERDARGEQKNKFKKLDAPFCGEKKGKKNWVCWGTGESVTKTIREKRRLSVGRGGETVRFGGAQSGNGRSRLFLGVPQQILANKTTSPWKNPEIVPTWQGQKEMMGRLGEVGGVKIV